MSAPGRCGALSGTCPIGPKSHHKCGQGHKRSTGTYHPTHTCRYCNEVFT